MSRMKKAANTTPARHDYILTISCPDQTGIVYRVSEFLFQHQCNILDSAQFGDTETQLFFLRIHFETAKADDFTRIQDGFAALADGMAMHWEMHSARHKTKTLVLVSQHGHCLNDLLFRCSNDQIPIAITGVVSNHETFRTLVEHYGIPFHYLPVTKDNKTEQEAAIAALVEKTDTELVVLARYMQVLSPALCASLTGRAINIHHSFLPSFKGANPYRQAHARGVKIIGATAHYVTADLDEGPIIEQDIERVDHAMGTKELSLIGGDVECRVLARAVKWHAERRIFLDGQRVVIFK